MAKKKKKKRKMPVTTFIDLADTGARAQPRGYKPGHSSVEEFLSR